MSASQFMQDWFEEVWNKGNTDHIDKGLEPVCKISGSGSADICNPQEFKDFHASINQGLSDIHCTILNMIENGDDVAGIVKITATHRKTGKPVEFLTSFIGSVCNGKVSEMQNIVSFLDILIQAELVPSDVVEKAMA